MIDIMVDLETLSVRPHSLILVIGAIKFKRNKKYEDSVEKVLDKVNQTTLDKLDTFYRRITIKSGIDVGLHIDKDTEKWWGEQDEDVKYEALLNPDRVSLQEALEDFTKWFGKNPRTCIWGNGSDFDISILGESFKRCNMEIPWKYFLVRDLRTIFDLGNVRMTDLPQYKKHHALYDCYRQIIGFSRAYQNLIKN